MTSRIIKVSLCIILACAAVLFASHWIKVPPRQNGGIKNSSYVIDGTKVVLKDGISSVSSAPGSASQTVTKYFGNEATGDLNGDGVTDVAFVITQTTGGSGTFYYAVVALGVSGSYLGTNAVFLGDRIAPQSTEIKDGEIIINYAGRKDTDPMTATPSVGMSAYLKVEGVKLIEVSQ